ncbi:hypothetical protein HOLleu_14034 [Holothuria leucospilota]|uniref:Ig-like domain-containing protein n=1 Tax=Holothuria leucospilota TaxID=206669 RepID=A0A9Q1C731_HOLLE|nr:hypothetical protein HOLleu_14034 [Holothuria leucospilota]
MFSYLYDGLLGIVTFSYVLISCRALTAIDRTNVEVIQVAENKSFTLNCPDGITSNTSNEVHWFHEGHPLDGIEVVNVTKSNSSDGGIYVCSGTAGNKTMYVIIGKKPSSPPEPQCLNSSDTVIQCIAYPGEFSDANKICVSVESILGGGQECNRCFTGNKPISCCLDMNGQWRTSFIITTTVENYVMSSTNNISYENLQKKVIPDQPTVVNMTATGVDSFTSWFGIPKTWDEKKKIFARGLYTQNGETHIVNAPPEHNSYRGQYGMFQFNTEESLAYSLVCWQIQIRFYYGLKKTTWSTPSDPICEYTFMAAPSKEPEELNSTSEQDKESPEFRSVTFSWKPPLEQYRNGIIDHYQLVLNREGPNKEDAVRNETIPGNVTNITFSGVESYETFSAKLTAWTQVGQSPPRHVAIARIPRRNIAIRRILVIAISVTAIIFLIILGRITWLTRQKVSANHLPEPYFIPEEKMNKCLAKKRFLPQQKEVFDALKGKAEESSTDICDSHDSSCYACTTPSPQVGTPFESCSATGSEVPQDTSYKSSSGASCYMLTSSTDSPLETDDTVGSDDMSELGHDSESKSSAKDNGQNHRETDSDVVNEIDQPKVITEKKFYDERGCSDGTEDSCHKDKPYANLNFDVPQEEWGGKDQTLQLFNNIETPVNNIIASRGENGFQWFGDEDSGRQCD